MMLILVLLPEVVLAQITFSHTNNPATTDITTITITNPSNVEVVYLSGNSIGLTAGIPASYFPNLPAITKIYLQNNELNSNGIADFCFQGVGSTLLELKLQQNPLEVVTSNMLKGLFVLHSLDLDRSQIHTIEIGR